MSMKSFFLLLVCFTASPSSQAFKSNSLQPSYGSNGGGNNNLGGGDAYRRPRQGANRGSSRSPISIHQESSCIVRLAADDDDSSSTATIGDTVQRRFSAASTEKTEIVVNSGELDNSISVTTPSKAATSTVNERLLSEIQASVENEKYGNAKKREYFKEFQ
ncbi:hypothetical protein ACHAXR_000012, partial [Thalassiosira sp. AJA248-18]